MKIRSSVQALIVQDNQILVVEKSYPDRFYPKTLAVLLAKEQSIPFYLGDVS
jgi:hypothetical protein